MRYSMSLYSDGIVFKFRFQKSHFTPKNREWADIFWTQCKLISRIARNTAGVGLWSTSLGQELIPLQAFCKQFGTRHTSPRAMTGH